MIRIYSLRNLLVLSSFIITPGVVMASTPNNYSLSITCPGTQGNQTVLTNFGNYIAGYGIEFWFSQQIPVYFRSIGGMQNVPDSLSNYSNLSVSYNSAIGEVKCFYQSSNTIEPVISVSYQLTNGRGGSIDWQNNNSIGLLIPSGYKS